MRTIGLAVGIFLVAGCSVSEPSVLSEDQMADLDDVLRTAVEAGTVPGVVALVVNSDRVLYSRAWGVMDDVGAEPMRADAIFRIYSMTKPITSVGIMMLIEDGLLSLDDAASDYLPELSGREVLVSIDDSSMVTRPASRPITIRDLLRHTSGFGYSFSNHELLDVERYTDIPPRNQPILHDPGTRWTYGMSTAFLGWIIEAVSGESLGDFFESRIMGPLEMTDTSFDLGEEDLGRLVSTYRRVGTELQGEPRPATYRPRFRGDGGLLGTAGDYARFIQMILGHGSRDGVQLLDPGSVSEMTRNQLDGFFVSEQPETLPATSKAFPLGAGQDGFGLGFQVSDGEGAGGRPAGSLSWAGIQNTHFWIDTENQIGVVLLVQVLPFYDETIIELLTAFERTFYDGLP